MNLATPDACLLADVAGEVWHKITETPLQETPLAVRVINDQLWVICHEANILVFDGELVQQRQVSYGTAIGVVYDASATEHGDVIMATNTGVYHTHEKGLKSFIVLHLQKVCIRTSIFYTCFVKKEAMEVGVPKF